MGDKPTWDVGPAGRLRAKYGLTADNRPVVRIDPDRVPQPLRHLIPLAERFGISDDLIREDVLSKARDADRAEIRRAVAEQGDLLDEWLAGPEADGPSYSHEYICFSAMRMAADEA